MLKPALESEMIPLYGGVGLVGDMETRVAMIRARIAEAAASAGRAPGEIALMAVTKTVDAARVRSCIAAGITLVGENRVQEMREKDRQGAYEGAALHFIGHLQHNKVPDVVGRAALIQSADSLRLLEAVETRAALRGLVQDVLLEVNIGGEPSKSGFAPEALFEAAARFVQSAHLRIRGLMCIPPPGATVFFERMRQLYVDISSKIGDNSFGVLSMGMSDDFEAAIRAGSTMVRVGTALFGGR